MVNFANRKVPVYSGINDAPRAPTAQRAGNGSDLINRYNSLIGNLETVLNNLLTDSGNQQESIANLQAAISNLSSSGGQSGGGQVPLLADTEWYVGYQTTRSDVDGLSVEDSFPDFHQAIKDIVAIPNPYNFQRTIYLNQTFTDPSLVHNIRYLPASNGVINIVGTHFLDGAANPFGTMVTNVLVQALGHYRFENLAFQGESDAIVVGNALVEFGAIGFGHAGGAHIRGYDGAVIYFYEDYKITSNCTSHISLYGLSSANIDYRTITIENNPDLITFAEVDKHSYLSAENLIINGSALGQKFKANCRSTIDTGTGNIDLFPGDVAGVLTKDSHYF